MIRTSLFLLFSLAPLCSLGCGGYSHSGAVTVSGVVTMDGTPVPFVEVAFESETKPSAFGITDEEGNYQLATRRYGAGALPGDYKIKIHSVEASANDGKGTTMEIPEVYGTSGYESVTVDGNQGQSVFDIELSSKPPKSKSRTKADNSEKTNAGEA